MTPFLLYSQSLEYFFPHNKLIQQLYTQVRIRTKTQHASIPTTSLQLLFWAVLKL